MACTNTTQGKVAINRLGKFCGMAKLCRRAKASTQARLTVVKSNQATRNTRACMSRLPPCGECAERAGVDDSGWAFWFLGMGWVNSG